MAGKKGKGNQILYSVLIMLLCAAWVFAVVQIVKVRGINNYSKEAHESSPANGPIDTGSGEEQQEELPIHNALGDLENQLRRYTDQLDGVWSVYVKDLSTGAYLSINNQQMYSASLIKLFSAGRYYEAAANGEIYRTEDSDYWLAAMIIWSDNDAWVELESYIGNYDYVAGLTSVTDFAARLGCTDTGRNVGAEEVWDYEADNFTSVEDVAYVLEEIYNRTYVSAEASQDILELMSMQEYIDKIPAGLPEGFEYANKTGELPGIQNDAAIIYGPDTDYIIVVMSYDVYDEAAMEAIQQISGITAHALNPSVQ